MPQVKLLLLLLLLSRFSRVRLCATPEMAAHQAPESLGFFRQEHWSGLPFPSPVHESEKWKWSHSIVSDSSRPHGLAAYQAPLSMGFSRQEYWSGLPLSAKHWWILIGWITLNAGNSLSKANEAHFFPYSLCGELVYHAWLSDGSWDGGLPSYWFSFSGRIVTRFT